jgi:hypothetical protein
MPTPKKTTRPRVKKSPIVLAVKPRQAKTVVKIKEKSYKHYDRLFLALALFAFIAVGLTITAMRSARLYQAKEEAKSLDATPLIFERHADLSPNCGSDPLVTVPDCSSE